MSSHLPAHCCCHIFTPACPVDCLQVALCPTTFHAPHAPGSSPACFGDEKEKLACVTKALVWLVGMRTRPWRPGEVG